MIKELRARAKRYPFLVAIYKSLTRTRVLSDWWSTRFPGKRRAVDTPLGFKLVSNSYRANRDMQSGAFEVEEAEVIQQHLAGADVFVDVGANIGLYTCLARSKGKYAIAIEPQPRNLECLFASLTLNDWADTEVFPVGLGEKHGLATLFGASGPSASLLAGWAAYSKSYRQTIPITTLDNLLGARFDGKKLLIKIDVEGAEYGVLCGARRTLEMHPRPSWMLEVCLNEFHPEGLNPNYLSTFEMFWSHGYEARTADRKNILVTLSDVRDWIAARRSSLNTFNYVFTPVAK